MASFRDIPAVAAFREQLRLLGALTRVQEDRTARQLAFARRRARRRHNSRRRAS
jgi:hypothetical protein